MSLQIKQLIKMIGKEINKFCKDVFYHTPKDRLNKNEIDRIKKYGLVHLSYKANEDSIRKNGIKYGHTNPMRKCEKCFTWFYINDPDRFEEHVKIVHSKGVRKDYDIYVVIKELTENQINDIRIRRKHYDCAVIYPGTLYTSCINIYNLKD